ncbi:glycosyltransferase [Luteitalea sp.]
MRQLSILFVAVRFPLPLRTGDRARAYHQIRLLARRHRVTLVTFLDDSPSAQLARAEIEGLGVRVVSVPFHRPAAVARAAAALMSVRPLQVALFDAPALRRVVASLLATERYDLIHAQLARALPLVPEGGPVPVFVDFVDALSLNMERRAARDRWPFSWVSGIDARRLHAYEQHACARVSGASVVSAADRRAMGDPARLGINPNGVDVADFPFARDARDADGLVFTGNLGYFPNVEAIDWFAREILPRLWQRRPACTLTIAGARPHPRVRALQSDARITVVADVPDLHPFLAKAAVAVAPMFTGSGQLLKVLEAMASGAPVVATTRALNGLEARHDAHVLVADDAERFANAVLTLLGDPARARRLAAAARHLVESTSTWEHTVADLEQHYARALQAAATGASVA